MYVPTNRLIIQSQRYYKTLKRVKCSSLNADIIFNRHGWNHLLYDGRDHRRSESQIRLRLFLLPEIKSAIQNHQGYPETSFKLVQVCKKEVLVNYYEINYQLKNKKFIRIIIRKFPGGEYHYYSVRRGTRTKNPQ